MVQMLQAQVGASADLPWAGPSTLLGVTGQYLELFNWVQMAYRDIQNDQPQWRWRTKQGVLSLANAQNVYTVSQITAQTGGAVVAPGTDLGDYEDIDPLHFIDDNSYGLVYDSTIGVGNETYCHYFPYQDWRGWKDRNVLPVGKPTYFTKRPDSSLEFSPVPNIATFVFVTDYKTKLDSFPASAANLPTSQSDAYSPLYLPTQYHEAIVWKALMYWATQRMNGAKYEVAKREYDRIMNKMYVQYLPEIRPYIAEYY
jgi:hypothetical protein